jgi:hypothetical protein
MLVIEYAWVTMSKFTEQQIRDSVFAYESILRNQHGSAQTSSDGKNWYDASGAGFSLVRLKPEPKLRPWKPWEVPLGLWIKSKHDGTIFCFVCKVSDAGMMLSENEYSHPFEYALENWLHSTDNSKTWLPCGVMEG